MHLPRPLLGDGPQATRQHTHWRWHLDEVYVRVHGQMRLLWRAVDSEGEAPKSFVTKERDKAAALKFMKNLLKRDRCPRIITTDGLRFWKVAVKASTISQRQPVAGLTCP